jgi:hypothetical protein
MTVGIGSMNNGCATAATPMPHGKRLTTHTRHAD